MVHELNAGHIAPDTDIGFQLRKYQTSIIMKNLKQIIIIHMFVKVFPFFFLFCCVAVKMQCGFIIIILISKSVLLSYILN